jgi:hypothetical protein
MDTDTKIPFNDIENCTDTIPDNPYVSASAEGEYVQRNASAFAYECELEQMELAGFYNRGRNMICLRLTHGDVNDAVILLLGEE